MRKIVPELKTLSSPDVDDLRDHVPADDSFNIFIQAVIGLPGKEGGDVFGLTIASPSFLAGFVGKGMFGRGYFIVNEFRYSEVWAAVEKYCRSISGKTWHEVAIKLNRIMEWEFEDYRPFVSAEE